MLRQQSKIMDSFVDKLCDHLPAERIKLLIDNGFEQWETVTYIKGEELIDLGFDTQECIIIMVAANSNAIQNQQTQIFSGQTMQLVMQLAKQTDLLREQQVLKQQQQYRKPAKSQQSQPQKASNKSIPSAQTIKEYPHKDISQGLLVKGTFSKVKAGQKINLGKVTVMDLQQKQITEITNLQKCPALTNLNLGNNYIYRIQGLNQLSKVKILKLEHNNITKIEGLDNLVSLQNLSLSSNYISRLQNLTNNPKLQQLYISKQKINGSFTFDDTTTQALSYTLEKLQCNGNKIKNITELKYLTVVREVYLVKNELQDVGQLSQTISGMQHLKILSFKDNPLTKSQKYRDYIVILSKTLQELDGKKILAKQRQYLVKLYALKHAKQANEDKPTKNTTNLNKNTELKVTKVDQQSKYAYQNRNSNLNRATDLRGNAPYANTKVYKK